MVAYGYIRGVSSLGNAENAAWLETQRLAIRRFCRRKRIELQDFFEERSEGGEFENSALERLMEHLEKEEADCAVVCGDYQGSRYNVEALEQSAEIRFFSRNLPPFIISRGPSGPMQPW